MRVVLVLFTLSFTVRYCGSRVSFVVGFRCLMWMHCNLSLKRVLFTVHLTSSHFVTMLLLFPFSFVILCCLSHSISSFELLFFGFCNHKLLFQIYWNKIATKPLLILSHWVHVFKMCSNVLFKPLFASKSRPDNVSNHDDVTQ